MPPIPEGLRPFSVNIRAGRKLGDHTATVLARDERRACQAAVTQFRHANNLPESVMLFAFATEVS